MNKYFRLFKFKAVVLSLYFSNGYKSPYDCGAADKYYSGGHNRNLANTYYHNVFGESVTKLSPKQEAEFWRGYEEEKGEKDWGRDLEEEEEEEEE
jgi:hypothetical protein